MEAFEKLTHPPVVLSEHINGQRLERLLAFYAKGGQLPLSDVCLDVKRKSLVNPAIQLRSIIWPTNGKTFVQRGNDWVRDREYTLSKSGGDRRFHSPIQQLRRVERAWLLPHAFSLDVKGCHFSILRHLMDLLYPLDSVGSIYPRICEYVQHREVYWDELNALVPVPRSWKQLFSAMLMMKSPVGFIRDEGFSFQVPCLISELWEELGRLIPMIVNHSIGRSYRPNGYTKMDMHEYTTKVMYNVLTAYESQQMLVLMDVLSQNNHPVCVWIHDGVEVELNGLETDSEVREFVEFIRPMLTDCGFSCYLELVYQSKEETLQSMDDLLVELEDVEIPISSLEMDYEGVKSMLESTDFSKGGRALCYIESRKRFLHLVKESAYPYPTFSSEAELVIHFKNLPMFMDPDGGKKPVPFIVRWLRDATRVTKSSARVIFPGGEDYDNPSIYNLYDGFNVEKWPALTEEEKLDPRIEDDRTFFWNHLRSLVDDDEHVGWWKSWFAHMFQYPGVLPRVAGVLHSSNQGAGKNLFESVFRAMLGDEYSVTVNNPQEALLGTFNASLEGRILVVINESTVNENSCVDIFTDLITNPTIQVRRMRTERYTVSNSARFLLTTNASNCTPIKSSERRFQVSSSNNSMLDHEYACRLAGLSENKRLMRALYEELMAFPMEKDYPFAQKRVRGAIYLNMQANSIPIPVRFLMEWLNGHYEPLATSESFIVPSSSSSSSSSCSPEEASDLLRLRGPYLTAAALYNHYTKWASEAGISSTHTNGRALESRDQFTTKLIAELKIVREKRSFSDMGVAYFREWSRKSFGKDDLESNQNLRQKHIWVFDLAAAKAALMEKYPLL